MRGRRWAVIVVILTTGGTAVAQEAAEAPARPSWNLPHYEDENGNSLTPSITLQAAAFGQSQSWYGKSKENLGSRSTYWFEQAIGLNLEGTMGLGGFGTAYGKLGGVSMHTQMTDAGGSDYPNDSPDDTTWEFAYAGWRSGDLFKDSLGEDALDVSFGRQRYEVGTGFIMNDAGTDGGQRASWWLGPHKSFREAGIVKLETHGLLARAVYLQPNDNPDSNTKLAGGDLQYSFEKAGDIGVAYYDIFDSDIVSRDGMNVFDLRAELTPLAGTATLPGTTVKGEFVYQENGSKQEGTGYYGELGYDFTGVLPWQLYLSYRYASFSGDNPNTAKNENFDPLFYGYTDWGTWYQGEILGEYVLYNQNLISHTIRLRMQPTDALTLNLLYYHFWLDDAAGFGVQGSNFADEVDLIADYVWNDNLSFSTVLAASSPHDGATSFTGGNDTWYYGMMFVSIAF